jgi:hypothetical protein
VKNALLIRSLVTELDGILLQTWTINLICLDAGAQKLQLEDDEESIRNTTESSRVSDSSNWVICLGYFQFRSLQTPIYKHLEKIVLDLKRMLIRDEPGSIAPLFAVTRPKPVLSQQVKGLVTTLKQKKVWQPPARLKRCVVYELRVRRSPGVPLHPVLRPERMICPMPIG